MGKLKKCATTSCGGCGYFVALIGAAVYYIQMAEGFGAIIVAILKSLVWPAFLVYEVLKFVGA